MEEIQIFNNPEFGDVRTMEIDGKPYFAANKASNKMDSKRKIIPLRNIKEEWYSTNN